MKISRGVILFWLITYALLTIIFGYKGGRYLQSFFFVSMILPVIISTSYFVNAILIPRYLLTERLKRFWLYAFYTLVITLYLESVIFILAYIYLANYKYAELSLFTPNPFGLAAAMYIVVLIRAAYFFYSYNKRLLSNRQTSEDLPKEKSTPDDFLEVRANRMNQRIQFDKLTYIESMSDYVKIFMDDGGYIITREKISHLETRLSDQFVRVHRSFIVNLNFVNAYSREVITIGDQEIPVSRTYKTAALEKLASRKS